MPKKSLKKSAVTKAHGPVSHLNDEEQSNSNVKKKTTTLTAQELKFFKDLLLNKKKELLRSVNNLSDSVLEAGESRELSSVPQHLADAAIGSYENYITLNLAQETADILKDIDVCLDKIKEKTYGLCDNCEKQISKQRLKVVPYSKLCIQCQQMEESGR